MRRFLLVLPASLMLLCALEAQAKPKDPLTQKEWLALKEISKDEIKTTFQSFLKSTNQKFPTPTAWSPTIYKIKTFCDHPFFEADTGFKGEWIQSIYKGIMQLVKIQNTKRMCRIAGNKKLYQQMDSQFEATQSKLESLMKHPASVAPKRLQALRKKAIKTRLAIKKKLDASGWQPPTQPVQPEENSAAQPKKHTQRQHRKKSIK